MLRRPWALSIACAGSRPCIRAHLVHERSTEPMELTSTPSISNKIPLILSFIRLLRWSCRCFIPSLIVPDHVVCERLYTQVNHEEVFFLVGRIPGFSGNFAFRRRSVRAAHRIPSHVFGGPRKGA